jgi:predicted esterase
VKLRLPYILIALIPRLLAAQVPPPQTPQTGVLHPSVATLANASHSYALYLPSQYTPGKKWPVLMAFDPGGNGAEPVKAFQQAAEKFGFIVAGSNNSRNFADPTEAIRLFSADLLQRYAIDKRRVYLTGFSGGARVASSIAMNCKGCVAGLIACGAGLPKGGSLPTPDMGDWFLTTGTEDFNYQEVSKLYEELSSKHVAARLAIFAGPHSWLPPALAEEALAWMQLRAMSRGTLPQDQQSVEAEYARRMKEAAYARDSGRALEAQRDYLQIAEDFKKLRETTGAEKAAQELAHSDELRKARKNLNASLDLEEKTANKFNYTIQGLMERAAASGLLFEQLETLVSDARRRQESSRDPEQRDAVARAIAGSFALAIESGQTDMQKKDYTTAKDLFSASAILNPELPAPHLLLARAHAAMNEKKPAMEELRRAVAAGLSRPESLKDKSFDSIRGDPGFQEIVEHVTAQQSKTQPQ